MSKARDDRSTAGLPARTSEADTRPWPRPPRPLTAAGLERAALAYLERFNASAEMLRRVLMRRADRAVRGGVIEAEAARALALSVLKKIQSMGYLSDRHFAETRAGSLHRRGRGIGHIRQDLAARGVHPDDIAHALRVLAVDSPDPDYVAAIRLARKRHLGPWRDPDARRDARGRDMAILARAGFDFDTARRVIDAETGTELEDILLR